MSTVTSPCDAGGNSKLRRGDRPRSRTVVYIGLLLAVIVASEPGGIGRTQSDSSANIEFEAVSIRPTQRSASGAVPFGRTVAPGRLTMLGVTPKDLIMWAYGVKAYQISGPKWISDEYYDVNAKAAAPVPEDRMRAMLRSALSERFHLASHTDTKTLPVYLLVVAKGGPKLRPAAPDGSSRYMRRKSGFSAVHFTMGKLAELLSERLDRPVTDATELGGFYDIDLNWTQDLAVPASAGDGSAPDSGPSIYTAIQETLGLKLEPAKAPIDVLVVDRIDRPSEN